ncbi:hypothetical protein A9Q81_12820 [Gammaproteobacteria bacterium 42_54_T18]|nr:hypothetical protein A9Q81_12820 [Gammaproteobacteria bacterium 42_54_T18]
MDFNTIIIGAGVSGIGSAITLDKNKMGSYSILESAEDLGGTWRTNKYPGVAVDIPSFVYQFSFEPNYRWSRSFAEGDEINDYLHHCAIKYDIKKHIQFNVRVSQVEFINESHTWQVHLEDGRTLISRYVIAATGIFHTPIFPKIPGRDLFKGKTMHTASWDNNYDYSNKRVGIIGTGASAVQVIPSIAPSVSRLSVFQRTPIWVGPKNDIVFTEKTKQRYENDPSRYQKKVAQVDRFLNALWFAMLYGTKIPFANKFSSLPQQKHLKRQVKDPELRKKLTPNYSYGCKRPAISDEYYQTFTRDNVDLINNGIERITETGIVTNDGKIIELDLLIYGTGYETTKKGNFPNFDIMGLEKVSLADYWDKNGYQSYNGVSVPGYPNLFLTSGPFSFGLNWFDQLESNLHLLMRVMKNAKKKRSTIIDVDKKRHEKHHQEAFNKSLNTLQLSPSCATSNSYYIDGKGQNTLPAVVTPKYRYYKVRMMDLKGFKFG